MVNYFNEYLSTLSDKQRNFYILLDSYRIILKGSEEDLHPIISNTFEKEINRILYGDHNNKIKTIKDEAELELKKLDEQYENKLGSWSLDSSIESEKDWSETITKGVNFFSNNYLIGDNN